MITIFLALLLLGIILYVLSIISENTDFTLLTLAALLLFISGITGLTGMSGFPVGELTQYTYILENGVTVINTELTTNIISETSLYTYSLYFITFITGFYLFFVAAFGVQVPKQDGTI